MIDSVSRRVFTQRMAAGLAGAMVGGNSSVLFAQRPSSVIRGVRIGIVSGSLGTPAGIIPAMQAIGLSQIELLSTHAEALAGAPAAGGGGGGGGTRDGGPAAAPQLNADGLLPRCAGMQMVIDPPPSAAAGRGGRGGNPSPEQQAAQERLQAWRRATTAETWRGVRRQFEQAGIEIPILWASLGFQGAPTSDEDIDYAFRMAQGLGVRQMSGSSTLPIAKRIAEAANRYKMLWAGHTQDNVNDPDQFTSPASYEALLALSPYFRINLDIGYFTAAGHDAVAFLRQHHARVIDVHLKDKKRAKSLGGAVTSNTLNNYPWGQGDTPIREVVQLIAREKWDIPVNIEYEYGCRTTADAVTEIRRCYAYVRDSLERI